MNRKERRAAKSPAQGAQLQAGYPITLTFGGKTYTPEQAQALAVQEFQQGNAHTALDLFRLLATHFPAHAGSHYAIGFVLQAMGQHEEALSHYAQAIAVDPNHADAYNNSGALLTAMQRYEDALARYDKAIALRPDNSIAYNNRGNTLQKLGRHEEALTHYNKALALRPDDPEVYNNRGSVLQDMRRFEEALSDYDKAVALYPDYAHAYVSRGNLLDKMKRYNEAVDSFTRAIAIDPGYYIAYNNRGDTLRKLKRYEEAMADFTKAIALKPDLAEIYNNRGVLLQETRQGEAALADFAKAFELKPDYADAYKNCAAIYQEMKQYATALPYFEKVLTLRPDYPDLAGSLYNTHMNICDWHGIDSLTRTIREKIKADQCASVPFFLLGGPFSVEELYRCAQIQTAHSTPPITPTLWQGEKYAHERIRIGYFSSDFRNHPLSHLMAEFFELHDRSRFEVTAFSFCPPMDIPIQNRLRKAFEHFVDVHDRSARDIALMARNMEIDIAVDLNGLTLGARTDIFAMRAAPVQMSYMGYPGTMGANYIDYVMADDIVIPKEHELYYDEKIIRLPYTYWLIDSTRKPSEKMMTRQEVGLPENAFVFCCFNNSFKITPDVFDIWMRLLQQVEGSVLWLLKGNDAITENLRAEAKIRGVDERRLIFAERISVSAHMARQRCADLFLDTFYYNAHTTASDALWEGLPVLTCLGKTFASRVAASQLSAAGLPELITHSYAEYEALALELALKPKKLAAIREKLIQNRETCPLFNTQQFTRYFEEAFVRIHKRAQTELAPENIHIPAAL